MGLDYYLVASHRNGDPSESEWFLFDRVFWLGKCLLSYFSPRLPCQYHGDGTWECRLTPEAWDALMEKLRSQGEDIRYLSAFVATTYSFDPDCPERTAPGRSSTTRTRCCCARIWMSRFGRS